MRDKLFQMYLDQEILRWNATQDDMDSSAQRKHFWMAEGSSVQEDVSE
jgi:hypothetical protein